MCLTVAMTTMYKHTANVSLSYLISLMIIRTKYGMNDFFYVTEGINVIFQFNSFIFCKDFGFCECVFYLLIQC